MKNIFKSISIFALTIVIFICSSVDVFAEESDHPYIVTAGYVSILNGASPVIFRDTTTGMSAYCLDYNRGTPAPESLAGELDVDAVFDPATFKGVQSLLLAGYPYGTGNGLTDAEAQACTQLAIWCWTYETMGYGLNADNYSSLSGKEHVYDCFLNLMNAARNHTVPDISISADDVYMEITGDMMTGSTTVTTVNLAGGYSIDAGLLPEELTVTGYIGNDGDTLIFTAPLSFAGNNFTINDFLLGQDTRSTLNLFWYDNSNPNQQRMVISEFNMEAVAVSTGLSFMFEEIPESEYGYVKVIKTSANTNMPLSGVVFGIYGDDGVMVCELVIAADGTATSEALLLGDYELHELSTIEGYELIDTHIPFTITENGVVIELAIENPLIEGKLIIYKTDEDGKLISDAVFGIFNANDEFIGEIITDINGIAAFNNLPYGDYYLKELSAPDVYELLTEAIPFEVQSENETVEVTVINIKTPEPEPTEGKIKLIKTDKDTNELLSGAVFGVYRTSDDVKIIELITSENGEAVTPMLPEGDYYLKELTAPIGYELELDKFGVTVIADSVAVITITNMKTPEPEPTPNPEPTDGKIKLIKVESETGKVLSGAVFGVYRTSDNVKITELITGENGEAVTPLIPEDDYYLKELTAPTGYELSVDKFGVTVKAESIAVITIANVKRPEPEPKPEPEPMDGKIRIIKIDSETGKSLAGAVFGVYVVSSDIKVCELTTNTYGEVVSPLLTQGEYYLREIKAPSGYECSEDKYGVTVTADKTTEITIKNVRLSEPAPQPESDPVTPAPETGEILIVKKAEQTGELLSGAVFGVYRVSDNIKMAELTTDSNGKATITLNSGEYYLKELTAPHGYQLESSNIYFNIKPGETTTVEVKNLSVIELLDSKTPGGNIEIPKTGESFPAVSYLLAVFLWGISGLCGFMLYRKYRLRYEKNRI